MPNPTPSSHAAIPLGFASVLRPGEQARPVDGASRYRITSDGRVLSTCSGTVKVTKPGVQTRGYSQASLVRDDGATWRPLVHVLVATAFLVPPPVSPDVVLEVHHRDGDKQNNTVGNLCWVSREQHARLELAIGGRANQKLSAVAVWRARCRSFSGDHVGAVADLVETFDVQPRTAQKVIRGRSWAWVPMPWESVSASLLAERLQIAAGEAEALLGLAGFRMAA